MDQGLGTMTEVDRQACWSSERPSPRQTKTPSLESNNSHPQPMMDGGQMHQPRPLSSPLEVFFFLLGFAKATCKLI